jgi:GNAT superfamily N-acetyltransferase
VAQGVAGQINKRMAIVDPRWIARRSAQTLREDGIRALWWQALAFIGVRRLEIHCRPTDRQTVTSVPAVAGVTVRELQPEDARAYEALRPQPEISEAELVRRIRGGDRCFGAWRGERLIAVHWLALDEAPLPYLGVSGVLGPDCCLDYEAYTAPEERRRGISNLLAGAVREQARSLGKTQLLSAVLPENRVSFGIISPRSRIVGTVASIRIGRWRLAHSSVTSAYLGRLRRRLRPAWSFPA